MKKQANLFDMVKKMKATPLSIALELSKAECNTPNKDTNSIIIQSQSEILQRSQVSSQKNSTTTSSQNGKRTLDAFLGQSKQPVSSPQTSESIPLSQDLIIGVESENKVETSEKSLFPTEGTTAIEEEIPLERRQLEIQQSDVMIVETRIESDFSNINNEETDFDNLNGEDFEVLTKKLKTEETTTTNVVSPQQRNTLQKMMFQETTPLPNPPLVSKTIITTTTTSGLKKVSDIGYNPYRDAPFKEGEDVPFSFIADCFEEVSNISGVNSKEKIVDAICNMFRTILYFNPEQLVLAYYFCIMKICPDYIKDKELGIGSSTLFKAISKATGRSERKLRQDMQAAGDLGKVAAQSKNSQSSLPNFFVKKEGQTAKSLTIKSVIETFRRIAKLRGNNSNIEKERQLTKLILDAKELEVKYLIRFTEEIFHIGASVLTMQCGLFKAFLIKNNVDEKNMKPRTKSWSSYISNYEAKMKRYDEIVTRAINEYPDFDKLIEGLIKAGPNVESILEFCKITVGIPVNPMLAQPTAGIDIVMKRLQHTKFTCEFKYDGLRGQIHYKNGRFTIFSRNQIDMTEAYPDVIEVFQEVVERSQVTSFIMDSEIVAFNHETQKILPFQRLSMRGRKNVDQNQIEVQVCVFAFDLMLLNDEPLLNKNFRERRNVLRQTFLELDNKFRHANNKDVDTVDDVKGFLEESIKEGAEGLMVKTLDGDAIYEPGVRSWHWLKLKKDYLEDGSADTFDLVPIGAYWGNGKRTGSFGGFLLACYNSDRERYETFCVCGRGFTDEELEKYNVYFRENALPQCPSNYFVGNIGANLWLKPTVVWEVKGSDVQLSPVYTAGIGEVDLNRGLGLRFPRVIKIREDKDPTDATDSTQIAAWYKNQAAVMNDDFL